MSHPKLPYADKNLGQHFLKEKKYILKITEDFKDQDALICEVGPGPAILTPYLAKHGELFVLEKDERFKELLKEIVEDDHIVMGDALEADLNRLVTRDCWMVSNLPYNISVPLMMKFTRVEKVKWMTLMMQKEVGERIIESERKKGKNRGSLMALMQNYFDIKVLCQVPPGAFAPPPKVDSVVLSFQRKENPEIGLEFFERFESFCRILFSNRRKQVGKVLKSAYEKERVETVFKSLGIELSKRAETFTQQNVIDLYKELHGH